MSDSETPQPRTQAEIETGIAAVLTDSGFGDPTVRVVGMASAGAVRSTYLIDIDHAGTTTPAVAQITSSSYAAERRKMMIVDEADIVTLAGGVGVPVAEVLASSVTSPGLDGQMIVSRRVDGESIPRRVLRLVQAKGSGERLAAQCGDVFARLHTVDPDLVPERVTRYESPNPAEPYVDSLAESLDELPDPHPALRFGLRWLRNNLPSAPPAPALIHGDLRNGNIIVGAEGDLAAVVDWEVAHVGDPMEDLAYICLRTWRFGGHDHEVGGFGSLQALRDAYTTAGGLWRDDAFAWWTAARTAWWGIGLAGQASAFTDGLSTSIVHAASGRRVVELEYDLLQIIGEAENWG